MFPEIFVKEITCADGALDTEVVMGFVPDMVIVANQMAATTETTGWIWAKHMPDLAGVKLLFDGGISYVATGGHISALDETIIDKGTENDDADPTRVESKQGITIAAAFHDTDDVISVFAFKSEAGD